MTIDITTELFEQFMDSEAQGILCEVMFIYACILRGIKVSKSKPQEDVQGIDAFVHFKKDVKSTVDVKSIRKLNRRDKHLQYEYCLVEVKNNNGGPGSIFGKAMYMAYVEPTRIIFVNRQELAEYTMKLVEAEERNKKFGPCTVSENAINGRLGNREQSGHKDEFTYIKTSDILLNLTHEIWEI